jgi:hypothetical protein
MIREPLSKRVKHLRGLQWISKYPRRNLECLSISDCTPCILAEQGCCLYHAILLIRSLGRIDYPRSVVELAANLLSPQPFSHHSRSMMETKLVSTPQDEYSPVLVARYMADECKRRNRRDIVALCEANAIETKSCCANHRSLASIGGQ